MGKDINQLKLKKESLEKEASRALLFEASSSPHLSPYNHECWLCYGLWSGTNCAMDYGAEPKTSGIEQSQPQQGKRTIAIALLNDRNRKKEINGREEKRVLHCCTYL